jgi:hypothetical protein
MENYNRKLHQEIRNFIHFKSFLEPNMFEIVIKIYKLKYGAISSVVVTINKQNIYYFLPWKIPV